MSLLDQTRDGGLGRRLGWPRECPGRGLVRAKKPLTPTLCLAAVEMQLRPLQKFSAPADVLSDDHLGLREIEGLAGLRAHNCRVSRPAPRPLADMGAWTTSSGVSTCWRRGCAQGLLRESEGLGLGRVLNSYSTESAHGHCRDPPRNAGIGGRG